ncbi:MAG TPA: calcium-binding protein, partial [Xanthomonadales bacterium]|nr:calcium-binding protein [Xanthomonadales bacterium]
VTQAALVKIDWTDSVGANPPFQYQYEAFSDAGYTNSVYQSVWLAASEIPTPGTPVGEYYLRVRARNASLVESAWSNDASNPYHITVVANPINAFPVPAECNQAIAYNKIEGTNGSDALYGTSGSDLILAKAGSDYVDGKGGADCIVGGDGSDALKGGDGADVILGGAGSDSIHGEDGADKLYGQGGSDALNGGAGADELWGGADSDSLMGEGGDDTLDGQGGSDAANGGAGLFDTCTAEAETNCEL